MVKINTWKIAAGAVFALLVGTPAYADIISATDATNPLAFFPLQTANGSSTVNSYTSTDENGASTVPSNGGPQANAISLNGVNNSTPQYVSTSLSGGINGAGSIDAWVNLSSTNGGAIEYIAGESQGGNDFDFQLVYADPTDESLCFYSDSGSDTCAVLSNASLLNQWNMLTATYDSSTGDQDIYFDGNLVASNLDAAGGAKSTEFTVGYSTAFGNRDFDGTLSDVGVWDYALDSTQVADLYLDSTAVTPPPTTVPEPLTMSLFGAGLAGMAAIRRRKKVKQA